MSTETDETEADEPETIGDMLTRLCAAAKNGEDTEPLRQAIIARFEDLEDKCGEALASLGAAYAAMSAAQTGGWR